MDKRILFLLVPLLAIVGLVSATFVVNERQIAIMLALGEIVDSEFEPGLHFRVPIYHSVYKFDGRILTLDLRPERVLTSEKKNLIVDSFIKWRIDNLELYYRATGGDIRRARTLLSAFVRKSIPDSFGKRTVQQVVSGEREILMREVQESIQVEATDLGIEVVDMRVKKVELPSDVSESVYNRMRKERATVAQSFRARGDEQANIIRADAERKRTEIIAKAYGEAQTIRGEGDANASEIYADAYQADSEFYQFYRSLNAYQNSIGEDDIIVLQPDSDFFRYFNKLK